METKSLKVSISTWKKLNRIKFEYGYKSIEEIVDKCMDIIPSSNFKKEKLK